MKIGLFCLLLASSLRAAVPSAASAVPGAGCAAPVARPGAVAFTLPFDRIADRAYWDFPVTADSRATSLTLVFKTSAPDALKSLVVHFQKETVRFGLVPELVWGGCQATVLPAGEGVYQAVFPRGAFKDEKGQPFSWDNAKLIRLSFWKNGQTAPVEVQWVDLAFQVDPVALVSVDSSEISLSALKRMRMILSRLGLGSAQFTASELNDETLRPYSFVICPYAAAPGERLESLLSAYAEKGGRLMLFYPGSRVLADALGVSQQPYTAAAPGMTWTDWTMRDSGLNVPAPTVNILPAIPLSGRGEIYAVWRNSAGEVELNSPACTVTDRGAWFSHLPPLASVSAVRFFRQLFRRFDPKLMANAKANFDLPAAADPAARAMPPVRRLGVWFNHPESRHPRGWAGALGELADAGVTDIFVHLQAAGTVYFTLRGRDVVSAHVPDRPEDSFGSLIQEAARHNIRVHGWVTCWTLDGSDADQQNALKAAGRLMENRAGLSIPWLCPAVAENQSLLLDGIKAMVYRGVAGVHLDYIRYPENEGCYAPATRAAFERVNGRQVIDWPRDVLPGGSEYAAYQRFRKLQLTVFIQAVKSLVQRINPACEISAAVMPDPVRAEAFAQEWPQWITSGTLDFVCPMSYADGASEFARLVKADVAAAKSPGLVWAGIGYAADESQLDARGLNEQLSIVRAQGLGGAVIFDWDGGLPSLLTGLPALKK